MLLNYFKPLNAKKYPIVFVYLAIGWQVLEAADVFIERYELAEIIFFWISAFLFLGLFFLILYSFSFKKSKIKVLVVDDHAMVRSGIKNLISSTNGDYKNIDEASNGFEALNLEQSNKYDLIFTDINMPVMDGVDLCKNIILEDRNAKIVAFTMVDDKQTVKKMLDAGASGYLLKSSGLLELQTAISKILNGGSYFSTGLEPI